MSERRPVTGEIYKHFKNKLYQIITIAHHSETGEELVIYQALYGDFGVCARPLEMFVSEVDHEKYPEVTQKYRFEKVERETAGVQKTEKPVVRDDMDRQESAVTISAAIDDSFTDVNAKMMAFFDTEDLELRYKILCSMREEITDGMIDNMAVVMDIVIPDGETANRYENLKRAIATKQRYEQNKRLR